MRANSGSVDDGFLIESYRRAVARRGRHILGRDASPRERSRSTRWLPHAHGIGIRSYPSGRSVSVAQARMGGRQRTVTIGSAAVLSEAQAIDVARRVLARALVGDNPAETRQHARAAPTYVALLTPTVWGLIRRAAVLGVCSSIFHIWKGRRRQAKA